MEEATVTRLFDPLPHPDGPFAGDKIFWFSDKLRILADGGNPTPITAEMDLTNSCNLSCPYCSQESYRRNLATLPTAIALATIEDLVEIGCKSIVFTGGGEPLVHPDAEKIIAYASRRGLEVALITNGIGLRGNGVADLAKSCTWIRISIDAHDVESYKTSKGVDAFERVVENTRELVRQKKETGSDVTIGVGYVTYDGNFDHFADAARLCADLGVDYLQARPLIFEVGDPRREQFPTGFDPDAIARAREFETDTFKVHASTVKYEDVAATDRGYRQCYGLYFATSIGADGAVWACCHSRGVERLKLGSLHDRPFKEIWNDVEHRREIYSRIELPQCMPLCRMHATNKLLERLNWRPTHVAFL